MGFRRFPNALSAEYDRPPEKVADIALEKIMIPVFQYFLISVIMPAYSSTLIPNSRMEYWYNV